LGVPRVEPFHDLLSNVHGLAVVSAKFVDRSQRTEQRVSAAMHQEIELLQKTLQHVYHYLGEFGRFHDEKCGAPTDF
jgi:hypothetical protein